MPLTATEYTTFERFLDDPAIDPHSEWVDGKVIPKHAVRNRHDEVVRWLDGLLGPYVTRRGLGRLLGEPFVMKLADPNVGRSPDLMFLAAAQLNRLQGTDLDGPADLAIEAVSLGYVVQDRVHKFAEYERGSVSEYWIIEPQEGVIDFYRLDEKTSYHQVKVAEGDLYRTPLLPELRLDPAWLKQRPLPQAFDIWKSWGVS